MCLLYFNLCTFFVDIFTHLLQNYRSSVSLTEESQHFQSRELKALQANANWLTSCLQSFLLCCPLISRGHVWPLRQEALVLRYDLVCISVQLLERRMDFHPPSETTAELYPAISCLARTPLTLCWDISVTFIMRLQTRL